LTDNVLHQIDATSEVKPQESSEKMEMDRRNGAGDADPGLNFQCRDVGLMSV
jgi:hypothetical protein